MTRPAIRYASLATLALGVCACSHAGGALPSLDTAEATPPPVAARTHRFNPFFRHASFVRETAPPLSSRSPISSLCASAEAKAVLDRDLPGLTTRPEFDMFKHMSLRTLQHMSRGKMSEEDVAKVDADLAKLPPEASGGAALQKVAMRQ